MSCIEHCQPQCYVRKFWPQNPPLMSQNPTLAEKCQFKAYTKSAMTKPMALISSKSDTRFSSQPMKRDITLTNTITQVKKVLCARYVMLGLHWRRSNLKKQLICSFVFLCCRNSLCCVISALRVPPMLSLLVVRNQFSLPVAKCIQIGLPI